MNTNYILLIIIFSQFSIYSVKGQDSKTKYEKLIEEINTSINNGDYMNSYSALNELLLIDSTNVDIIFAKATICERLDKYQEALSLYKKIISIDSNYFNGYYNLGVYYYNLSTNLTKIGSNANDSIAFIDNMTETLGYFYQARRIMPNEKSLLKIISEIENLLEEKYGIKYDIEFQDYRTLLNNLTINNCLTFQGKYPNGKFQNKIDSLFKGLDIIKASEYKVSFCYADIGLPSPMIDKLTCNFLVSMSGGHIGREILIVPEESLKTNSNLSSSAGYSTYKDGGETTQSSSYYTDIEFVKNKNQLILKQLSKDMYSLNALMGSKFYMCDFSIIIPIGSILILPSDYISDFGVFEAFDGYIELLDTEVRFSDNTKIHIKVSN